MKVVETNIEIKTKSADVIRAFTDPDLLRSWWAVERTLIELKVGGLYTLAWGLTDKGMGYISTGIIRSYLPDRELVIGNWLYMNPVRPFLGPMTLSIYVEAKAGSSLVKLVQGGYRDGPDWDWYYEAVRGAWPGVMGTLKVFLESRVRIV